MEKFQISKQSALQRIKAADHMFTQSYLLIGDTKILLAVINNIYQAIEHCITALLQNDRVTRTIPPFHDNFDSKLHVFRNISARQHNMAEFLPFILAIKEIEEKHKSSPVEFTRKDSFVICDDNFSLKVINAKDVQKFINEAKRLYVAVDSETKGVSKILSDEYA